MEVYCTRPRCPHPQNYFADLDDITDVKNNTAKILHYLWYATDIRWSIRDQSSCWEEGDLAQPSWHAIAEFPECVNVLLSSSNHAGNLTSTQLQLAQQLFEREAEVLAQIGHEHEQIPELICFFSSDSS